MTNKERRERLKCLRYQIRILTTEVDELMDECNHENIDKIGEMAHCDICNEFFGWYCANSPTLTCDYYNKEEDKYNEDCCIYCGQPEERK